MEVLCVLCEEEIIHNMYINSVLTNFVLPEVNMQIIFSGSLLDELAI
jgi:hypothetical protein